MCAAEQGRLWVQVRAEPEQAVVLEPEPAGVPAQVQGLELVLARAAGREWVLGPGPAQALASGQVPVLVAAKV